MTQRLLQVTRRAASELEARRRARSRLGTRWPAGPPWFVGVGVQRAGTSWWFSLLERHPQVHRLGSARKELHFFDELTGPLSADDIARYHDHFRPRPGRVSGEWTPRYLYDAATPALLHQAAPDARLLVLLRDPVERFRSGMTHSHERGRGIGPDVVEEAIARGLYHEQLVRLLDVFPREQVLVQQFERCRLDPRAELRRTVAFLGLDPDAIPDLDLARPRNQSVAPLELSEDLLRRVRRACERDVLRLGRDFPDVDLDLWPSVAG